MIDELLLVLASAWTPLALPFALGAGLAMGVLLLGYLAELPAYATAARPGELARTVFLSTAIVFGVFYGGQIAATVATSDPWERIVSRYLLSVVYAAAMAFGLWVRLRAHFRAKHRLALELAREEIADGGGV